jgi:two-component system, OmpR family, sensor histidine kinase BaeS
MNTVLPRRGRPLSIRLALYLSVAVLAVLLVAGIAVNRLVSRSLEDELSGAQRRQLSFLADQLEGATLPFAAERTDALVRRALQRMARAVQGRAELVNADGTVYASAGLPLNGVPSQRIEEPIPGSEGLSLVLEVPGAGQPALRVFNVTLLVAGILSVVALMLVAALLSERVTRPLRGVANAAGRLGAGDLSARAEGGPDRESAELAEAFNAMAGRLEQSEALRRRAASDVAHDLATPATVLESQLQAMIDGVVPADAEQLEHARAAAGAMSGVVAQLRDLVDVEAAALQRRPRNIPLADLLDEMRRALEPLFRERGVRLTVGEVAPELSVHVDSAQVERAIRNVLTNAAQHSAADAAVHLSVGRQPGRALVRVTDAGPGIEAADLPHVFERFYRADRARQPGTSRGGSGIGLTIARELLVANGGTVDVEESGPGGTTFVIGLPIAEG